MYINADAELKIPFDICSRCKPALEKEQGNVTWIAMCYELGKPEDTNRWSCMAEGCEESGFLPQATLIESIFG